MSTYLLVGLLLIACSTNGQMLDTRLSINLSISSVSPSGDRVYREDQFTMPSLYSNLATGQGLALESVYKFKSWASAGVRLTQINATDWQSDNSALYSNAVTTLRMVSPLLRFHNRFSNTGWKNRLTFYAELSANAGRSNVTIHDFLRFNGAQLLAPARWMTEDNFYGGAVAAGLSFHLSRTLLVFSDYQFSQNFISSGLYPDTEITYFQLRAGMGIRLLKDKRYFQY